MTYKNADLCNALAATQLSRNTLEREVILLKRTLLEERSKLTQPQGINVDKLHREIEANIKLLDKRKTEIVSFYDKCFVDSLLPVLIRMSSDLLRFLKLRI